MPYNLFIMSTKKLLHIAIKSWEYKISKLKKALRKKLEHLIEGSYYVISRADEKY